MNKITGNEPALPQSCTKDGYAANVLEGMTIRMKLAESAMIGITTKGNLMGADNIAERAFEIADAMILKYNESRNVNP